MSGLSDRIANASAQDRDEREYAALIQDPAKAIDGALVGMQRGLERLRLSTVSAINSQSQLRLQLQQAKAEVDRWQQRVQLAQRKRLESLAEGALERQQSWLITVASLTAQLNRQSDTIEALERQQVEERDKLAQAQDKRDALIERAKKVLPNSKMQQLSAFERMEDKVLQMEALSQVDAWATGADLECVHLLRESGSDDDDIAAMKELLLGPIALQKQAQLPSMATTAPATATTAPILDAELEALKEKLDQL